MDKTEMNTEIMEKEESAAREITEKDLVIKLKTPVRFEGVQYDVIDLSGLKDIKAKDMVDINRRMTRNGNVDATPELTLEYALYMANIATGLPLELFEQLPPNVALAVRGKVTSFLFRSE